MAAVAGSQLCLGDREGAGRGCGDACGRKEKERGREYASGFKETGGFLRGHMPVVGTPYVSLLVSPVGASLASEGGANLYESGTYAWAVDLGCVHFAKSS
jgi:hypothetical protein